MSSKEAIRIGLVPIDDRPCNLTFLPEAMRGWDNIHIETPPQECLGHFNDQGNYQKLADYLVNKVKNWDYLILSIDALCYGGLVQARQYNKKTTMEAYFERLSLIKLIKKINPKIKILAYSVIIRLTTTVNNHDGLEQWEKIFDYSRLAYLAEKEPQYKNALKELKETIDEELLRTYLNARKRNHVINLIMTDYVKLNLVDHLSIIQEDSQAVGIHLLEHEKLQHKIKELELTDQVILKNGTDEMPALLGALILNQSYGPTKIYLESNHLPENYIAKYEDRPLKENIAAIFKEGGFRFVETPSQADVICYVLTNENHQQDYVFESEAIKKARQAMTFKVNGSDSTKPFVVLDLQDANGASLADLIEFVTLNQLDWSKLAGYSGWNTASNSIGTVALDCAIAKFNKQDPLYLEARLLDDAIYQGDIRQVVAEEIKGDHGNIWFIEKGQGQYEKALTEKMREARKQLPSELINQNHSFSYKFPWKRTFEIEIRSEEK